MMLTTPTCETLEQQSPRSVGLGQAALGFAPDSLWTVLGSCIGIALVEPQRGLAALAHVVLPAATGHVFIPTKFADTAIPHVITLMERAGASRKDIVAKIAGGACMYGSGNSNHLGQTNIKSVKRTLLTAGIPLVAEHLGGTSGRRVTLECGTGIFRIEILGGSPVLL